MATDLTQTSEGTPVNVSDTTRRVDLRHDAPGAYRALAALTRASTLEHGLAELVKTRASQINGCAYCVDLHAGLARKAGEQERRLHMLAVWREAPFFTARERAALALTEALTLMSHGPVPEQVYEDAARHFGGTELSQLVVVITGINAWNRVMVATGEQPPPIDA
jgi:AhpD family alkylhydroperoxidase